MRPIIGITGNYSAADGLTTITKAYYHCVERAGGAPVILPPTTEEDILKAQLDSVDGLLFTGGADLNPLLWGEEPSPKLGGINAERDRAELILAQLAYNRNIPMFGICRGLQTLVAAFGGKLMQDISDKQAIKHSQDAVRSEPTHTVNYWGSAVSLSVPYDSVAGFSSSAPGSATSPLSLRVNSFHHQVAAEPGSKFTITATSPDGFIEAVESSEHKPIVAVQWHPENLYDSEPISSQPFFKWLIKEAEIYNHAKRLHNNIITLDSHCDTPMFFHLGVNLSQRAPNVLVDFQKMQEGKLDVSNMVCYLPQPIEGNPFSKKIHFPIDSPKQYADFIFDSIEQQIANSKGIAAIARTVSDIKENKRHGRRSIMLGIENGLALEGDIKNIEHFAKRGITYITLCHNGDNEICDSCRGNQPYGGLSDFGKQVIAEMNRLGILVDLSHAAEATFYDAIRHSTKPIVCSHSNCRALCDHPRNLTDEQMRALAQNGGVMQITMYPGFLAKNENATIIDALKHLRYAIEIMGIDHVGIGTDFDGDGGIPGLSNASDMLNLTRHLIKEGYTDTEIEKIWGGNWLRLLQ